MEIICLLPRKSFAFVSKHKIPTNQDILEGRNNLATETGIQNTENTMRYQLHKDKEKTYLSDTSKIIHIRAIRLLNTLSIIYELSLWNQDVRKSYIQ